MQIHSEEIVNGLASQLLPMGFKKLCLGTICPQKSHVIPSPGRGRNTPPSTLPLVSVSLTSKGVARSFCWGPGLGSLPRLKYSLASDSVSLRYCKMVGRGRLVRWMSGKLGADPSSQLPSSSSELLASLPLGNSSVLTRAGSWMFSRSLLCSASCSQEHILVLPLCLLGVAISGNLKSWTISDSASVDFWCTVGLIPLLSSCGGTSADSWGIVEPTGLVPPLSSSGSASVCCSSGTASGEWTSLASTEHPLPVEEHNVLVKEGGFQ